MDDINEIRARVISQEKGYYRICAEGRTMLAEVSGRFRHETLHTSDFPTVGDYVTAICPDDGSHAVITGLFPRKSLFLRKAAGSAVHEQAVAANIDTVFVCMSLNMNYNLRRMERYLALSWDSGAVPVVVLTKADLCEDTAEKVLETRQMAAGADVIAVSSLAGELSALQPYLRPGKTIAFMGSSGVGKSTLINALLGQDRIATSAIGHDDKGRHTTTRRELIELPCGACLIDTPGMRELGIWENEDGIGTAFADIEALAASCRFSDCCHENEPGCAVRRALLDGSLDTARWESYRKLKQEAARIADTGGYFEAKREKFKTISKINKAARKR